MFKLTGKKNNNLNLCAGFSWFKQVSQPDQLKSTQIPSKTTQQTGLTRLGD